MTRAAVCARVGKWRRFVVVSLGFYTFSCGSMVKTADEINVLAMSGIWPNVGVESDFGGKFIHVN